MNLQKILITLSLLVCLSICQNNIDCNTVGYNLCNGAYCTTAAICQSKYCDGRNRCDTKPTTNPPSPVNPVEPHEPNEPVSSNPLLEWWVILLIVVGCVIVIILLTVIICKCCRKKKITTIAEKEAMFNT